MSGWQETVLLEGKSLAADLRDAVRTRAAVLADSGTSPSLAIVVPTHDDSTAWYVRSLVGTAEKLGVHTNVCELGPSAGEARIRAALADAAADPAVHGIILQTPLPAGTNKAALVGLIPPTKDVDGVNPSSLGGLVTGTEVYPPATAEAVMRLLDHHRVELRGKRVTVVGRSVVVGKPVAHMLLDRDATVTIAHSRTVDLPAVTRAAEVLVVAVGRPGMITADFVAPGAVVVDVGTNDFEGSLVGDVDAQSVQGVAGAISPVPGGIGPVTTALLFEHTITAAERAAKR